MVKVKQVTNKNGTRLIGPNCPGIITVDECKLGIMPGFICKRKYRRCIKSGTLTYEAIDQLVNVGLGQTTAVGIGGDPIIGTTMKECLELFEKDPDTEGVVIIGEIGGQMEIEAANGQKIICRNLLQASLLVKQLHLEREWDTRVFSIGEMIPPKPK